MNNKVLTNEELTATVLKLVSIVESLQESLLTIIKAVKDLQNK